MSKLLLSENKIKTIPLRGYRRDLSNGANDSKNIHCMEMLFSYEVFIKQANAAGTVPRGSSRECHVGYMDSLLTVQKC